MKNELYRVLRTRKSIIFISLLIIAPLIDLGINVYGVYADFWKEPSVYPQGGLPMESVFAPAYASFLSGSSLGMIIQMLYIWILPMYLLLIYSDFYIQDRKMGYINISLNKISRKKYLKNKFLTSFILCFCVAFVGLVLNFFLANIIFHGGTSFAGMDEMGNSGLLGWSVNHATLAYSLYIVAFSIISGLCGMICTSVTLVLAEYKYVYPVVFLFWLVMIMLPNSLTYVMQPFIEYGYSYVIPGFIRFVLIALVISIAAYFYKVKQDEI